MNIIHLDFETRSEVDIFKVGAWNYSVHPSTEILCMAYAVNNGPIGLETKKDLERNYLQIPVMVFDSVFDKNPIFTAHYSMFENYIWHNILVKRYGWPKIPLRQWRCTAAKAASHALPRSLKNAADALDLKVRKDEDGKRIMLKMCKPRRLTKKEEKTAIEKYRQSGMTNFTNAFPKTPWHEKEEDFEILYDYCINDVKVEREIDHVLPDLSPKEQEVWFLDQAINTRGVQVDTEAVNAALELIQQYTDECNEEVSRITNGYLDKVTQTALVLRWIERQDVSMPDYTKATVEETLKKEIPSDVKRVLKIRQQTGKTSVKKYDKLKSATDKSGRLRDMFVYCGASTGRFAGKGVQLHNLPRGNIKDQELCISLMKRKDLEIFKLFYPDVMGAFSSCVRGMLIAAPGKDLLVGDYASIEARVVAWLAGEELALKYFREKEDAYVKMAEIIFECPADSITSAQRFVGKQTVLGCGYGMGAEKFRGTCQSLGQEVSEELAKKAVYAFRGQNKNIVKMWYDIEAAAIRTVREGSVTNLGNIRWSMIGDFLYCTLPSGRKLAYHHPKIEKVPRYEQMVDRLTFMGVALGNKYVKQYTWGGTLVENIVQAIARDILVEGMLRCEKVGHSVVMHVHDEIVVEQKEGYGSLDNFLSLIIKVPAWAEGCPIEAEGWRGKRYKK